MDEMICNGLEEEMIYGEIANDMVNHIVTKELRFQLQLELDSKMILERLFEDSMLGIT
jgi:hypothetical protein